ncbi:unnamed protein product [Anisakis simplex]|uniref:Coiled-coil domain-containing protein 22 homolog n=1 Tax=Anisakis simplex TaxID=6269 RepID=A0A0M3JV85_ANISI|nr:unnamed protein product [Anisakis simplex]
MSLDFVDHLIVDTLLRLDKSFFNDNNGDSESLPPRRIDELSLEQVFSAIVLLLWSCNPLLKSTIISQKLPNGMAARYRYATDVVDAIKNVGVRDEIGYQSLLYDARTALIESAVDLLRISETAPSLINKYYFYQPSQNAWHPSWGVPRRATFRGFNGDVQTACEFVESRARGRSVLCASLEANSLSDIAMNTDHVHMKMANAHLFEELLMNAFTLPSSDRIIDGKRQQHRKQQLVKPPVHAKPKPSIPPKPAELSGEAMVVRKEKEEIMEKMKELSEIKSRLNVVAEECTTYRAAIEIRSQRLVEMKKKQEEHLRHLMQLREQDTSLAFDPRIKQLIDEPETISRLTKYIEESEDRMESLQNRWIATKQQKDDQLRQARLDCDDDTLGDEIELVSETRHMKKLASAIEAELSMKEEHLVKLKREVERMEQEDDTQLNRSVYTRRIFEIVANIRKQQEQINEVHSENRQIQKEINSLIGKLDRTFTVVEEKLYRDTQRDVTMQKAYRLLVKIHEQCSWVISATEACGRLNREIDELNDQIALQQQKRLDETLEKLLNDWMEVKNENDNLLLQTTNDNSS